MTERGLALLLVVAACGHAATPAPVIANPEPAPAAAKIVVGQYASMTGPSAVFGISTHQGVELAVEDRNAAGGVGGRPILLVTLDDAGEAAEASVAVTRLIDEEGAKAILGEVSSGLALVGGPIAQAAGVPMIAPSATNPEVTEAGDMVFRVCFLDDFQGYAAARFAIDQLHATRAAVVLDQTQAYSTGLAAAFEQHYTDLGGTIVAEQAYSGGSVDPKALLPAMKGADVVFLPGYYNDVGVILRATRDAGIATPFIGGDGWDSPELATTAGDAVNGSFYIDHFAADEPRPEVEHFVAAYRATYGEAPDALAALGYDAAALLFDAMSRARSLGGDDLRDAIAATRDFAGVTGAITIGDDRNPRKSAVVMGYENGAPAIVARIDP